MTKSIHSAVLALENAYRRLYHIDAATNLLQRIEHGDIDDIDDTLVNFTTLATEVLKGAMSGIFDECHNIEGYLEARGGECFLDLVENAMRSDMTAPSDELGEVLS
ncbi:MAG: hypothetical protein KME67_08935 [Candidatus Thiodiazotropha sp. (ex Codakia orbicularis)]|nr:hypothetical protein [Candidatus Thiodiazotropha sp. (ex Codakia orbicularis)]